MSKIDPFELRKALGAFMTGVTVVTTIDETGSPRGFTANSFTSVSLDPPLILVCIAHSAFSYPLYTETEHFAVNILAESQKDVSGLFAGKDSDKFSQVQWTHAETGSPVLTDTVAWMDCRVHDRIESGDHLIVVGRVVDFRHSAANPLGFCRGAYLSPELEQEAMPTPGQSMRVGAILESGSRVLLVENQETGELRLPCGSRLGRPGDPGSLEERLSELHVDAEIGFIFAVFEEDHTDRLSVYYRGQLRQTQDMSEKAQLFRFDEIPWEQLPDSAVTSMLRRFVQERTEDRFGIYVGDFDDGQVQQLAANR